MKSLDAKLSNFNQISKDQLLEYIKQMSMVINASSSFISFIDSEERYQFVNQSYEGWFGLDANEIKGKQVREVVGEANYLQNQWAIKKVLTGERVEFEAEVQNKNGETFYFATTYVPYVIEGAIKGYVTLGYDISKRKKIEKNQKSLADLATVLASLNDPEAMIEFTLQTLSTRLQVERAWLCETEGDKGVIQHERTRSTSIKGTYKLSDFGREFVHSWQDQLITSIDNIASHALTKASAKAWTNLDILAFMVLPLYRHGNLSAALAISDSKTRKWEEHEMDFLRSSGKMLWSQIENAHLLRALSEAVQARDEFISICSHELKTPLTSMHLQFQLAAILIKQNDDSVYSKEHVVKRVSMVNRQLVRMSRLVEDMLDVSRITAGKLSCEFNAADLNEVLLEAIERFKDQLPTLSQLLVLEIGGSAMVMVDKNRLHQVFMNLISNAIKYGAGKPFTIKTKLLPDSIRILFIDQGHGIAPAYHEKIFQRFERVLDSHAISGLGLGLYISRQILQHHDGKIWVESTPGHGSTFIVELPLLDKELQDLGL